MATFLVVDDHELMRSAVRHLLLALRPGSTIEEAGTADLAQQAVERARVDLVVLDLGLEGRSGLDLLAELNRKWPEQRVLVLSGYSEDSWARRALASGARGYVAKSAAADELRGAVSHVLEGGRYVSAALAEGLAADLGSGVVRTPLELLSARELEVLRQVAKGASLKETAAVLHLSQKTVETYRARIAAKLGLSSNVALTRFALRNGIID
ncbi:MAG: response regulator transcription factor [Archangium sp.]|nr:response regulator transcription factor [Archangium sp.]